MPNYQHGKIYALRSHQTDQVYIGSTTRPLSERMANHRWSNDTTSAHLMIYPDVYIELVEAYPCASKEELNRREGHWIRNTPNCVNRCVAGRTKSEYMRELRADPDYQDNMREYLHNYRQDPEHKEKQREYLRQWRAKKKLSAENNVLQVSGGSQVQSAGEKVQGNLSE